MKRRKFSKRNTILDPGYEGLDPGYEGLDLGCEGLDPGFGLGLVSFTVLEKKWQHQLNIKN